MSVETAVLFMTYLNLEGYAASTVHTYMSLINHMQKLEKGPDLMSFQLVRKTLDGIDKTSTPKALRQPITLNLLEKLMFNVNLVLEDPYSCYLYKALFSSMFFMCARVGEVALSQGQKNHVLQLSDITFKDWGQNTEHLEVSFTSFKHNKTGKVHKIPVYPHASKACPILAMKSYLSLRGGTPGPLFTLMGSTKPIPAAQVSAVLSRALRVSGENPELFGTHSFRIGRCSELASQGASSEKIKFLGRFHSDAFMKYVRPQVFRQ